MEGEQATPTRFKQVTVFDPQTRVLRSRAFDDAGKELYVFERRLKAAGSDMKASDILLEMSGDVLAKALIQSGIPVQTEAELSGLKTNEERRASEKMHLNRNTKGLVSWVISATKKQSEPQLWVEKDTFLPTRFYTRHDGDLIGFRFENFRFYKEFPFPRVTTLVRVSGDSEESVLREEAVEVVVNPDLKELKTSIAAGFTDHGNSTDSSVRSLIHDYYEMLR